MKKKARLIIALLCAIVQGAWAQNEKIQYIDYLWNDYSQTLSLYESETSDYTELKGNHEKEEVWMASSRYYVIKEADVRYKRLIAPENGTAYLILCDGAKLTAQITIDDGHSLEIYGQSENTGQLVANGYLGSNSDETAAAAGIGSIGNKDMGSLAIHGGTITARGADGAAGIGGGGYTSIWTHRGVNGGDVTIYGGKVTAYGGLFGAGIGGGCNMQETHLAHADHYGGRGGHLTVYGGEVYAYANSGSAAIGGGSNGNGGSFTIWGGIVKAYGNGENGKEKHGAGIGSGHRLYDSYNGGNVYIHGGKVYAYGGAYGAGIGGGQGCSGANVEVDGGYVYADGGLDAAGIGSGEEQTRGPNTNGGTLVVNGGHVYADGTGWGAGIGAGEDSDGASIEINGGIVEAYAGSDAGNKNGSAIGSEDGDNHRGTLRIHDCMMVNAGQTPNGTSLFPKETRVPACFFRPYAKIEPCTHSKKSYTVDAANHYPYCLNCKSEFTSGTHFDSDGEGHCVCGYKASEGVWTITLAKPGVDANGDFDGSYSGPGYDVAKGQVFILPECDVIVNGYTFKGWVVGSTSTSLEASDGATFLSPGEEYTPTSNSNNIKAHYEPLNISLADNANNEETLYMYAGKKAHSVTLADRTLFKDGKWNTLCLPFSLSAAQIAANRYFAGATLKTLDADAKNGFDTKDGTLYLSFKTATAIEAGVPYLVKWKKAADYEGNEANYDISNPVFEGVTVSSTAAQAVESTTAGLESVQMVGCYSPVSVTADDKSILFLGDANTLYYSTIDRQIRSCRAYFSVPYIKNNAGAKARAFALSFDDEEVTGIKMFNGSGSLAQDDAWYSLDGVRLSGKPTQRGLYINNGKKVVIK